MTQLIALITNRVLISAAAGWFTAQVLKMLLEFLKGDFSVKRLSGGGGMPSTHSSTVSALAISSGLVEGFGSTAFAIALFLAIIVMYDARGVRYETGQQARILNHMRETERRKGSALNSPVPDKKALYEKGKAYQTALYEEDKAHQTALHEGTKAHPTVPAADWAVLDENMGHTLPEIIVGVAIGLAVGILVSVL